MKDRGKEEGRKGGTVKTDRVNFTREKKAASMIPVTEKEH